MSMETKTIAMIGYDISHLSGYIEELELAKAHNEWINGIPEYSLNFVDNDIGYDQHTKSMFGRQIFDTDDVDATEEGTGEEYTLEELSAYRKDIWAKYKQFLFDHTKIVDKTEPPLIIKFISWWS